MLCLLCCVCSGLCVLCCVSFVVVLVSKCCRCWLVSIVHVFFLVFVLLFADCVYVLCVIIDGFAAVRCWLSVVCCDLVV